MTVSPVSSGLTTPTAAAPVVTGPKTLGSADFMKLLAVQFEQQDPMKPMDDTAFIAQMAQFTSLSQTQTMTTQMTQLAASQGLAAANSYIGYQVTVDNGDGTSSTGVVSAVQVNSTGPQIMVGGKAYGISSVKLVQPAPVASSPAPAAAVPVPVSTSTTTTTPAGTAGGA